MKPYRKPKHVFAQRSGRKLVVSTPPIQGDYISAPEAYDAPSPLTSQQLLAAQPTDSKPRSTFLPKRPQTRLALR